MRKLILGPMLFYASLASCHSLWQAEVKNDNSHAAVKGPLHQGNTLLCKLPLKRCGGLLPHARNVRNSVTLCTLAAHCATAIPRDSHYFLPVGNSCRNISKMAGVPSANSVLLLSLVWPCGPHLSALLQQPHWTKRSTCLEDDPS